MPQSARFTITNLLGYSLTRIISTKQREFQRYSSLYQAQISHTEKNKTQVNTNSKCQGNTLTIRKHSESNTQPIFMTKSGYFNSHMVLENASSLFAELPFPNHAKARNMPLESSPTPKKTKCYNTQKFWFRCVQQNLAVAPKEPKKLFLAYKNHEPINQQPTHNPTDQLSTIRNLVHCLSNPRLMGTHVCHSGSTRSSFRPFANSPTLYKLGHQP
jgi:hypothetical protein